MDDEEFVEESPAENEPEPVPDLILYAPYETEPSIYQLVNMKTDNDKYRSLMSRTTKFRQDTSRLTRDLEKNLANYIRLSIRDKRTKIFIFANSFMPDDFSSEVTRLRHKEKRKISNRIRQCLEEHKLPFEYDDGIFDVNLKKRVSL